jgi:aryl-alcohol dehydrogenase-like predicted oxidoreductase
MSFGGFYGPTSEADSMRALARALDLGVDFWDTANVYGDGLCEQVIGKFLAEDKSRRARVTLATKFAIRRRDDGSRFFDNSAAHIREALDGSRKRLGVDHIDLYYVHRVDESIPIEDTVEELARLSKAGAIGAIGLPRSRPIPLDALAICIRSPPFNRNIRSGHAVPNLASSRPAPKQAQFWSPSRRSDAGT